MTVLRFQVAAGITSADLTKKLPVGTFTSVTATEPGGMLDVTVTAGGVSDATEYMTSLGYTLFATDPANSLEKDAATEIPPVDRVKLADGTVLTATTCTDGQILSRSGTSLVGTTSGASFDIRDIVAFDHFMAGSTTTERIGVLGWLTGIAGTGADLVIASAAGHPGYLDMGAGTVAAGRCAVYIGDPIFTIFSLLASQNTIDMEWLVRFNSNSLLSASNERFTIGWGDGFDNAASVEHANGIYCEFAPATSANFQLVTAQATVRTRVNSTIAVTANVWWRIGLQVTYPGGVPTAKLFINGTLRATGTLTFPILGMGCGVRIEANATALEARVHTDYVKIVQVTEKET